MPVFCTSTASVEEFAPTTTGVLNSIAGWLNCAVGIVPVPPRLTNCGEGLALSATDSDADRLPVAVGAKVTRIGHEFPALSVALGPIGQLFVCAKSPALVPVMEILEIVSGPVPVFFSVTVCGWLGGVPGFWPANVRLDGVKFTPAAVPVPLTGTVCGEGLSLSLMETAAMRLPVAAG